MSGTAISRRRFAAQSISLIVGFSLVDAVAPVAAWFEGPAGAPPPRGVTPSQLDSWLSIDETGLVTIFTGRIDMGTGIETAFSQLVADELDAPIANVRMVMGDTGLTPDQGKSTGSNNTRVGWQSLRVAAAEARLVLLDLAAQRLAVGAGDLTITDGVVHLRANANQKVSFGELMKGRRFDRTLKVSGGDNPALVGTSKFKDRREYKYIGKSIRRDDVKSKAAGKFIYVSDVRVPGMLHGRVVRPTSVGAKLLDLDESSVRSIPTIVKVVRQGDFVGVVAEREEHAIAAAKSLKVRWSDERKLPETQNLYTALRNAPSIKDEVALNQGDVDAALQKPARKLHASYRFPMQLHGMIGPSCAVADVKPDGVTIWSGTQWPHGVRGDVAGMLGVPPDSVRVIWVEASGAYGRLGCDDAAGDAALLSKAVGRPVRVQWMRHDEHGWEPLSPAMVMEVQASLTDANNIDAWEFQQWSSSHSSSERQNLLAWRLIGTAPGWDRLSSAPGVYSYVFPHTRQTLHYVEPILRTIYLRAPGRIQHNFASESFMDEVATAAGVDPIEFRLRHLKDPNAINAMTTVARLANWEPRTAPRKRKENPTTAVGSGFAFGEHSQGQQVALAIDVAVNLQTANIEVRRVVCVSQCGLIVNPDGLKHQVEGAILQGLSRSLTEEVRFTPQAITSLDWASYPIMRFPAVPKVEVTLVDQPDSPSVGVGETATIPVAAALCNAICDATGIRLRQVPLQGALRDALKG